MSRNGIKKFRIQISKARNDDRSELAHAIDELRNKIDMSQEDRTAKQCRRRQCGLY